MSGEDFTSKHFRTWGATIHAAALFAATPTPETATALKREANAVIDRVAARLGNTRAVCRSCYIHPRVFEEWEAGTLAASLAQARGRKRTAAGLDDEETTVRAWLAQM